MFELEWIIPHLAQPMAEFVDFLLHIYYAQRASQHAASESADLFNVSAKRLFPFVRSATSSIPRRSSSSLPSLCSTRPPLSSIAAQSLGNSGSTS